MLSPTPLKQLNRQTYKAFHRDGIIDILLGIVFWGFGLWLLLNNVLFTFVSWLSFSFYAYLKRTITIPRFGYVRFEEDRRQRAISLGIALVIIALLLLAQYFLMDPDRSKFRLLAFFQKNHVYVMSSIWAVLLIIYGFLRGLYRFAGYGFLLLTMLISFYFGEIPGRNALFIMGGLTSIIGVILLGSFIRENPIIQNEVERAE